MPKSKPAGSSALTYRKIQSGQLQTVTHALTSGNKVKYYSWNNRKKEFKEKEKREYGVGSEERN